MEVQIVEKSNSIAANKRRIEEVLSERFKKLGSITTSQAFELCREYVISYDSFRPRFNEIMQQLIIEDNG